MVRNARRTRPRSTTRSRDTANGTDTFRYGQFCSMDGCAVAEDTEQTQYPGYRGGEWLYLAVLSVPRIIRVHRKITNCSTASPEIAAQLYHRQPPLHLQEMPCHRAGLDLAYRDFCMNGREKLPSATSTKINKSDGSSLEPRNFRQMASMH